jgi:hypothetical protein
MGELLGQIAVVGEKEEALGLGVEPADIEKLAKLRRKKIEDRIARVRVASGRNKTGRFIQHEIKRRFDVDEFATDFDVVARGRLCAEIRARAAVDGDATGSDQLVAVTARPNSGRSEITVQPHG